MELKWLQLSNRCYCHFQDKFLSAMKILESLETLDTEEDYLLLFGPKILHCHLHADIVHVKLKLER